MDHCCPAVKCNDGDPQRNSPDPENRLDFAQKMKKSCPEAQLIPLPRDRREPVSRASSFSSASYRLLVAVRQREKFRGEKGVADRKEEDHGCHEIEWLGRDTACEPLPQVRNPLIAIAVGRSRENGLIRTGRGCRRVARAGKKSAEQNQAENQFSADFHGMAVWRLTVKIQDIAIETSSMRCWPAICKVENHI